MTNKLDIAAARRNLRESIGSGIVREIVSVEYRQALKELEAANDRIAELEAERQDDRDNRTRFTGEASL